MYRVNLKLGKTSSLSAGVVVPVVRAKIGPIKRANICGVKCGEMK